MMSGSTSRETPGRWCEGHGTRIGRDSWSSVESSFVRQRVRRGFALRFNLQVRHSPQIECHADEFPLAFGFGEAAKAELAKPQHRLDPPVGWLDDVLAPSIGVLDRCRLQ